MKCSNCSVVIKKEFAFAINKNQCPACGSSIMGKGELKLYAKMQKLLTANGFETDADKISTLIITNFNLEDGKITESEQFDDSVFVSGDENPDPDAESKAEQLTEGRAILKKLRDDALGDEMSDKYGIEGSDLTEHERDHVREQARRAAGLEGGGPAGSIQRS